MSKPTRTPEEKTAIVLEGIKCEITVTYICRKHAILQTMYYPEGMALPQMAR